MINPMGMVRAWVPGSEAELAVVKSLLESEGIAHFVQGDTSINHMNAMFISHPWLGKAVWVDEAQLPALRMIIGQLESASISQVDLAESAFASNWRRMKRFVAALFLGTA